MSCEWQPTSVPTSVAGYNICERIGGGSFSVVYKGLSAGPGPNGVRTTAAIKCINRQKANSSRLNSDCVVFEISALKKLKHRNIVHLYEFHWDKNNIYLIMEYCGGGDLASFLKTHGSLPEDIARRFFRQLAAALQYMRALDVAHMDLKPQNILLTNKYHPFLKVSDFGLSQKLEQNEWTSSFRGSPLYMAPEVFTGRYDSSVDLWSAGVILYECLYGRPPFCADSYEKLVSEILSSAPISYPSHINLSADCLDLLKGLLVRNPKYRMTFEKFFSHPFVAISKAPSTEDLAKADEYLVRAKQAEAAKNIVDSIRHLTDAIQIYMSCLEMFDDPIEKARLRQKIESTLDHAESLKESLRPKSEEKSPTIPEIKSEWPDIPQVDAAILIAKTARKLQMEERWSDAEAKYMLAIEGAMRVLSNEKDTSRAKTLQRQVASWLSSAEHLKAYVAVVNLGTGASEADEEAEKRFKRFTDKSQCRPS